MRLKNAPKHCFAFDCSFKRMPKCLTCLNVFAMRSFRHVFYPAFFSPGAKTSRGGIKKQPVCKRPYCCTVDCSVVGYILLCTPLCSQFNRPNYPFWGTFFFLSVACFCSMYLFISLLASLYGNLFSSFFLNVIILQMNASRWITAPVSMRS